MEQNFNTSKLRVNVRYSNFICFHIKYIIVWTFHTSLHPWHPLRFVSTNMHITGAWCVAGCTGSAQGDFSMISGINKLFYVLYPPNLASLRAYKQSWILYDKEIMLYFATYEHPSTSTSQVWLDFLPTCPTKMHFGSQFGNPYLNRWWVITWKSSKNKFRFWVKFDLEVNQPQKQ